MRREVDLNSHINQSITRGNPADFEISLEPLFHNAGGHETTVPNRHAIVRKDDGRAIAIVSDRYSVVTHNRILEAVNSAIAPLDVGPVPKGIYVDAHGAKMRAIYKFPALAAAVRGSDEICPCLQVRNTYDGTSRIAIHIGAFRFVCTNLAVGGGGVFAGGFVSVHAGEIPVEAVGEKLADYLQRFTAIVAMYRQWTETSVDPESLREICEYALRGRHEEFRTQVLSATAGSVFDSYNQMTDFATHRMRAARSAFELLDRINESFQRAFPTLTRDT